MILAIPVFRGRISPRFDCACRFLLFRKDGGKIVSTEDFYTGDFSSQQIINSLFDRNVDVLLCGGIDSITKEYLEKNKIKIISWLTGDIQNVIDGYLCGNLRNRSIVERGGRCRRRWRFRGHS
ncbi:MAG: NifB/NifX family molybdenum-iron cluster-binding protein [Verrucomicrobiota bacterium]|nr:NifB/NifX family molybdenum-iron cluster-binding protein [Verrucomicrobiota bacterium]